MQNADAGKGKYKERDGNKGANNKFGWAKNK